MSTLVSAIDSISRVVMQTDNHDSLQNLLRDLGSDDTVNTLDVVNISARLLRLNTMRMETNVAERWVSVCRQKIMLAEASTCLRMLDLCASSISTVCRDVNQPGTLDEADWLTRLITCVLAMVRSGVAVNLNSATFLDTIHPPIQYTDYRGPVQRPRYPNSNDLLLEVQTHVSHIVELWFAIPDMFKIQAQARFVSILVQRIGVGVLLLPGIWAVYTEMPLWLFSSHTPSRRTQTVFTPSFLDGFDQQLSLSDITKPHSRERSLFAHLHTLHHSSPANPLPVHSLSSNTSVPIQCVILFLQDAWDVATYGSRDGASVPQQLLYSSDDQFMPLREMTFARRLIHSSFTPGFLATSSGLFSLLVFRNVLYNSGALRQSPRHLQNLCFQSEDDFSRHFSALKAHFVDKPFNQNMDFYCNRKAYGHLLRMRSVDNVSNLWTVSQDSTWPPADFPLPFVDALQWILALKQKYGIVEFGALGQYSLVADMCGLRLVEAPTVQEMGRVIKNLNLGGIKGLCALGYLPTQSTPSMAVVVDSFSSFFTDVQSALQDHPHLHDQWTPVIAEHTLCKVTRMIKKKCYNKFC